MSDPPSHIDGSTQAQLPSLEIQVPISPTPLFLNMVHCLVSSLRRFGGGYKDAPVVVTVGDKNPDPALQSRIGWLARNGVEIRWLDPQRFRQDSWHATAVQRFCYEFTSDVVLQLDADVLIAGPLDEMVRQVHQTQAFGGVIAFSAPFKDSKIWQTLYTHCQLGDVPYDFEHTGWGYMSSDPRQRYCPAYFNFGVLCAPAPLMAAIGQQIYPMMHRCSQVIESFFKCQIALTLAIAKQKVPTLALPTRFNFPNEPLLEALHHRELAHTRLIHLLGKNQGMRKNELYRDLAHIEAAIKRDDLRCINALAQQVLRAIFPKVKAEQHIVGDKAQEPTLQRAPTG